MSRKANFSNDAPFTEAMAESYFSAIKTDFDSLRDDFSGLRDDFSGLREEIDSKFAKQDEKLNAILNVVKFYDVERKELKASLWEHERRLLKLERV